VREHPGSVRRFGRRHRAQSYLEDWREQYRANRDLVVDKIAGSRYRAPLPDGGIYVWLDISSFGLGSEEFALQLLERCNVAVTPGTAFGTNGEGRVRLSLATTKDRLEEGIDRMLKFS
jgi:aspartate/methionine/tyrosine aminotransferase